MRNSKLQVCSALVLIAFGGLAGPAYAQVVTNGQLDPKVLVPETPMPYKFRVKNLDTVDLTIRRVHLDASQFKIMGQLDLTFDIKNVGKYPVPLGMRDTEGETRPTYEIVYLGPDQSLAPYFSGETGPTAPTIIKRGFLEHTLNANMSLSHLTLRDEATPTKLSLLVPQTARTNPIEYGTHRLFIVIDPGETLLELNKRNNFYEVTWYEQPDALDAAQPAQGAVNLPAKTNMKKIKTTPFN